MRHRLVQDSRLNDAQNLCLKDIESRGIGEAVGSVPQNHEPDEVAHRPRSEGR